MKNRISMVSQIFSPPLPPRMCLCLQVLVKSLFLLSSLGTPDPDTPCTPLCTCGYTPVSRPSWQAFSLVLGAINLPKNSIYEFSDPLLPIKANSIRFSNIHTIFPLGHLKASTVFTRVIGFYINKLAEGVPHYF